MSQQHGTPSPPPAQGGWGQTPGGPPGVGWGRTPGAGGQPPGGPGGSGGWGPSAGGGGGWGSGPGRPRQVDKPKPGRTQWIVLACAALAVALVAVGVVLLVNGGGQDDPAANSTPNPVGSLYTPATPTETVITKGPNDKGVEVGHGVWFTPAKGWLRSPDRTVSGQYWILQQFSARGLIDGYYWVRQTQLYDAKGFAEKLVDVESKGFKNVKIAKGQQFECSNPAIKVCFAISYTADVPTKKGPLPFKGFVTAYQDGSGWTTATDAGLEARVYQRRVNELQFMNKSVEASF